MEIDFDFDIDDMHISSELLCYALDKLYLKILEKYTMDYLIALLRVKKEIKAMNKEKRLKQNEVDI